MAEVLMYGFTFAELAAAAWIARKVKLDVRSVSLCGMMVAVTLVLSMVKVPLPTGGSLCLLSVLPGMLVGLILGPELAVLMGVVSAVMLMLLNPGWAPIHPMQFVVEHLVCMTSLGFAGLFGIRTKGHMMAGLVLAGVLNLLGHIFAGVLFFGAYAPAGMGVWKYSIVYNVCSQGVENLLAVLVVLALPVKTLQKTVRR